MSEPRAKTVGTPAARTPDAQALARFAAMVRDTGYSFTAITPASHKIVNARPGNAQARSLRDVFGWSRPFHAELLPAGLFETMSALDLLEEVGGLYKSKVRFSRSRGNLFMHSAFPTEAKDAVYFGPDTYPFVEAVVESLARRRAPLRRAVDICSGAGPGAIAIATAAPEAEVTMVDVNALALRYGAANAVLAGCPSVKTCLGDKLADLDGAFDLVVAHPPYMVDRADRAYRHGGGDLGAELSLSIVRAALERLAPQGTLVLFTGIAIVDGEDPFEPIVGEWASRMGCAWTYRETYPDVFGEELAQPAYAEVERIAHVVFEATRGSGAT